MSRNYKHTTAILLLTSLAFVTAVWAKELCEDKSQFVDSCFSIHGRLFVSNGTPGVRIWKVGTKRVLGVVNDSDTEDRNLPAEIAKIITTDVHVYGDFEVCPLTKPKPKEMQMVCLMSGKNLTIRKIQ